MSSEIEKAKELVERNVRVTQTKNLTVVDDGSNEVKIPGFPYIFKAQGDKILVAVDVFKSGYECKSCKGTGRIVSKCYCDFEGVSRPGFKYHEIIDLTEAQLNMKCPECKGDYLNLRVDKPCDDCKGLGTLLHMPDTAKSLPTTGVVVSKGPLVDPRLELNNHDRVLFGAFSGIMIPTKAPGVVFKVLRDIEILCTIRGGEDMAVFDFVTIDKDL